MLFFGKTAFTPLVLGEASDQAAALSVEYLTVRFLMSNNASRSDMSCSRLFSLALQLRIQGVAEAVADEDHRQ